MNPHLAAVLVLAMEGGPLLGTGTAVRRKETPPSPAELSTLVRKSVVVIECSTPDGSSALGSGFYVDPSGFIATNAHVVSECSDILIRDEGSNVPKLGRALLLDEDRDIAIVGVERTPRPVLALASSVSVLQGQRVYAIGHPEGLEYTISEGIVSAFRDLSGTRLIQTTAPISPGSSGGPLVNDRGHVVGMTTLFLKVGQNLNFAVPADAIRDALTKAKRQAASGQHFPAMSPATAVRIARSLRERKQFESASKIVSAALKESPSRLDLLLEWAEIGLGGNRLTDAEHLIRVLIDRCAINGIRELRAEKTTGLPQAHVSCPPSWSDREFGEWWRRLEYAEGIARRMIEIDPNFAPAHEVLGFVLTSQFMGKSKGSLDDGCREHKRCLELNPDATYAAYRAQANAMLFVCEMMKASGGTFSLERATAQLTLARPYIEAALDWEGFRGSTVLHVEYASLLDNLGEKAKANAAAKNALALASISVDERDYLKEIGLPRQGVRVVSQGQTEQGKSLGMPIFTGIVINEGIEAALFVRVIVECKDTRNIIVGTGTGYLEPTTLRPGDSGSFEVVVKGPIEEGSCAARIAASD